MIDPLCDMTPVRSIDPDLVSIDGGGGQTDITAALELALMRLKPYVDGLQRHAELGEHPLPLVLLFSDGEHNVGSGPELVASEIKGLNLNGEPVVIAVAGVSVGSKQPDERTLREIASPECYVHITNAQVAGGLHRVGRQFRRFPRGRRRQGHQADPEHAMSQGAKADLPLIGHPEFDLLLRESQAWLAKRGEMVVGSGSFQSGRISGAIHSDFGPPDQDKATNQDYALAWWPSADEAQQPLRFVLALADGLTTSFRSECASALACWVGIRALVENALARRARRSWPGWPSTRQGLTIGRLADELARDPEASCPEGQFLSTWKYILRKGGLFQTTLTLAWLDREYFRIAMVGDGGVLWRGYRGPRDPAGNGPCPGHLRFGDPASLRPRPG